MQKSGSFSIYYLSRVFIGEILNLAYLSTNEYKHIVRIVGNDIHGEKKLVVGLTQIRGIGFIFANAILDKLEINNNGYIGNLTDAQVTSIENLIKNPSSGGFPDWFLNRRKDVETGKNMHLITSDIALTVRNDIEREKGVSSWRGIRHMFGLKVRGQCTRTTGRKGGAVGVKKGGKILPAGGAGAPAAEGAAPAEGEAPAADGTAKPAASPADAKSAPSGDKPAPAAGKAPDKGAKK